MISEEKILAAKILAVDDNILNIQILKKILTSNGFINITTTTDSTKAVELYKEINPDLLLLDLNMPKIDGFGIMAALKELYPNDYLPILVLTAEEEALRFKALQSGAKDFLEKPYNALEVLLRSRSIIEVRQLYQETKLHNLSLEEQVIQRTKDIRDTRLDVIQRLANAAEMRDADTGAHIQRMSIYCEIIAQHIGFTPTQCELVLTASPLHDIGKLAIPDAILLKPGALTPEEFEIMKQHTLLGAKILNGSNSPFLKMAESIALTHHEKWDGSGYPHKLRAESIPTVGRICAVADVFDALTSPRPYKKAWGFDEAFQEIIKGKETHFDPKMVEAFCDAQKDVKAVYDHYR